MFKRIGICVCAILAIATLLEGATVTEYSRKIPAEYEHSNKFHGDFPFSFFTPRIEWARPYNLGKLKLLVVLPVRTSREAVELGSRLDAEVKVIYLKQHHEWYAGGESSFYNSVPLEEVMHDTATRLLSPAYKYDAIVIGHVKWTVIPEDVRKLILGRVKSGTALVFVSPWDVDEVLQKEMALGPPDNPLAARIRESVPIGVLPLDMDLETPDYPKQYFEPRRIGPMEVRAGKLGEGNVVFLDYKDGVAKDGKHFISITGSWFFYCHEIALTPFVEDDDLFYDYYFSILAKVLLHAAGKETGIRIQPEATERSVEQKQLPGSPVGFALSAGTNGVLGEDVTIYYELRDRQNRVVKKGESPISREGEKAKFAPEIPSLAQGLYILDAWVMRGGTIADWASAALHVTGTEHIEAIIPDKEFFSRNEPISGTLKYKSPLKGVSVSVELWDTYQRLEQVAEPGAKDGKFQFKRIENPLSRTYRIVCKVLGKGLTLEQKETWVGLPSSEVDDFQLAVWAHAHNTRGNRTLMQLLCEQAITAYYDPNWFLSRRFKFQSADALARHNLLAFPYTSGCWEFAGEGGPWSTEAYYRGINVPAAEAYRRYGAFAYSICEENFISADEKVWSKPPALNDYRLYLKERYGDVGRLNEIWGTQFKSFEEIGLISFQDAKVGRQSTRWLEQQRHRVDRFTKAQELSSRIIRESDPEAKMTLDACVPEMYDWQRMAKAIQGWTRWCPLERWLEKDGVNLAAKKGNLASTGFVGWYPNTINEWYSRTSPWQNLFLGYTHIIWWPDTFAFTPDRCEPILSLKQTAEECREIESGAGKLLLGSQKRLDPILILWSLSSYYASIMNPLDVVWNNARESFESMLRHTGLDYQYIGEDFLENNLAYGTNQKVLILPASQAISRKGVESIKNFVRNGGLAIADYPPAVMDEYLRLFVKPAAAEGQKVEFQTCPKCNGAKQLLIEAFMQTCPACGGTGSTVKGGEGPAKSILEDVFDFSKKGAKPCGKGYGLYLAGSPNKREEWAGLRKSLVENQGIRGDVEILDILGNLRTDLNWHVFDNGRAKFVGVVPPLAINTPPGVEFTVRLKEKQHGYNVRMHKYLGLADTFQSGILATEAKLFAFLPERIEGIKLSVPKKAYGVGETIDLGISILPASLGDSCLVVRVEVRKGDRVLPEYTKNVSIRGTGQHAIPLALNQEKGEYRVRATEIISGNTQEVIFRVK